MTGFYATFKKWTNLVKETSNRRNQTSIIQASTVYQLPVFEFQEFELGTARFQLFCVWLKNFLFASLRLRIRHKRQKIINLDTQLLLLLLLPSVPTRDLCILWPFVPLQGNEKICEHNLERKILAITVQFEKNQKVGT